MKRKFHTVKFKKTVIKEAIKKEDCKEGNLVILAQKYGVSPSQISEWKQIAEKGIEEAFKDKRKKENKNDDEESLAKLLGKAYLVINKQKAEIDFLEKVLR